MVIGDGDVAIEEQQPVVLTQCAEVITGGGTTGVRGLHYITTMGQGVDSLILMDGLYLWRSIVGHEDLIVDAQCLCLLLKHLHQSHAYIII